MEFSLSIKPVTDEVQAAGERDRQAYETTLLFLVNLVKYFGCAKNAQLQSKWMPPLAEVYVRWHLLNALQKFSLTWSVGLQPNNRLVMDLGKRKRSSKGMRLILP